MDYIKSSLNWEEFFIAEAIELEEKMNSFDHRSLGNSRLRLAIEFGILDWKKYQNWFFNHTGVKSITSNIEEDQLSRIREEAQSNFSSYSNYSFWNQDLIPIALWEDSLIVFGLAYDPQLSEISNVIFILAHPDVLSYVGKTFFPHIESARSTAVGPSLFQNSDPLPGLLIHIPPETDDSPVATYTGQDMDPVWEYISERHEEYSFEVKKQFNAYAVLRIANEKTQLYKMDSELEKKVKDKSIFTFSLKEKNPFSEVYKSGVSESFNINQLGLSLLEYKYICITALKRGPKVVGFLLGLKQTQLAEDDQVLLEELAKESA